MMLWHNVLWCNNCYMYIWIVVHTLISGESHNSVNGLLLLDTDDAFHHITHHLTFSYNFSN